MNEHIDPSEAEQQQVLRVGLKMAQYVHTDDTGARHQGRNGYCTVIGIEWFAYFRSSDSSSDSKSRRNFLEVLQGEAVQYVLNQEARCYLQTQPLAAKYWSCLQFTASSFIQQTTCCRYQSSQTTIFVSLKRQQIVVPDNSGGDG